MRKLKKEEIRKKAEEKIVELWKSLIEFAVARATLDNDSTKILPLLILLTEETYKNYWDRIETYLEDLKYILTEESYHEIQRRIKAFRKGHEELQENLFFSGRKNIQYISLMRK